MKKIILLFSIVSASQMVSAQNVGIGTTTPTTKLEVLTPDASWGIIHTNGTVRVGTYAGSEGGWVATQSTHPLYFATSLLNLNGSAQMALLTNGNFGIGTITPAHNLDILSTGNAQLNLTEGVGLQTALLSRYSNRLEIQPSDAFQISVGGIDRRNLCVANNGYVGISTSTPTNYLQIGSYTNANYGGNQLALGFGTNVTVMNQYAGYSNFLTNTPLNIQSTNDIYLMPANGNGHVGINTNTPTYPLEINGNPTSWGTDINEAAYYGVGFTTSGPGPSTQGTESETSVALYVNGSTESYTYYAISDKRVKDIIGVTNNQNDLETLNRIKVTDYTMKDRMTFGARPFKKVIAQELEEVYPLAVNKQVNFIPNTYLQTDKLIKNDSGYVLHFSKAHNISKNAKFLKVYSKKGDAKLEVIKVLSDFDVQVKAEHLTEHLFVYGEQVDDFRAVDYEALTTLNISATQELNKQIQAQQKEIDALKEAISQLKNLMKVYTGN